MSKPIRSYPEEVRPQVIARRIASETMGLGYWSARDAAIALIRKSVKAKQAKKKEG